MNGENATGFEWIGWIRNADRMVGRGISRNVMTCVMYTAVSTKVVPQKRKSVRDNADWYYG